MERSDESDAFVFARGMDILNLERSYRGTDGRSEPGAGDGLKTAEELRAAILERYDPLSKRLQQIARYVLDEPNEMALETLAVISDRCGVQPSAIVRFAKTFGYPGASQMQRLFRDGLLSGHAALGYGERVRHFNEAVAKKPDGGADVLAEFVEGNTLALQNLGPDGQRGRHGRRP